MGKIENVYLIENQVNGDIVSVHSTMDSAREEMVDIFNGFNNFFQREILLENDFNIDEIEDFKDDLLYYDDYDDCLGFRILCYPLLD